jgi:transcriptional regulator with XRE-family HTH domain
LDYIIQKIKHLQNEKNLSVPKLAEKIGLTKQAVYDIYKRKTAVSIKNLELFSEYFKVPMTYWFQEESNQLNEPEVRYGNGLFEQALKELREDLQYFRKRVITLENELDDCKQAKKNT